MGLAGPRPGSEQSRPGSPYLKLGRRPGARRGESRAPLLRDNGPPPSPARPPAVGRPGTKARSGAGRPSAQVGRRRERGRRRRPSRAEAGPLGGSTGSRPVASRPGGAGALAAQRGAGPRAARRRPRVPAAAADGARRAPRLPSLTHPQLGAPAHGGTGGDLAPAGWVPAAPLAPTFPSAGSGRQVPASKAAANHRVPQ